MITITFIILATLLLWLIIGAKGWWKLKALLSAVVIYFSFLLTISLSSYLGWSTDMNRPDKFELLASKVVEDVCIYILLEEQDVAEQSVILDSLKYKPKDHEPRFYKFPYTRPLHEAVVEGQEMINNGQRVMMELNKEKPEDGEGNVDSGEQQAGNADSRPSNEFCPGEFKIYELPSTSPGVK